MAGQDWDVAKPIDHLKVSLIPQKIRDLRSATKDIMQIEHVALGDGVGGQHLKGATRVYIGDSLPTTDPESSNLDTSATSDDGRIAVATGGGASTGLTNTIKVYIATSAGISTGWEDMRAGYAGTAVRVRLGAGVNVVGQHNTGAETYVNLLKVNAEDVPEILVGAVLSADTDPATGVGIAPKKYVDDQITSATAGPGFYKTSGSTIFSGSVGSANTFQDLDASSVTGAVAALLYLEVTCGTGDTANFRPKGFGSGTFSKHTMSSNGNSSVASVDFSASNQFVYMVIPTNSSGIFEWGSVSASAVFTIKLIGYIK